MSRGKRTVGRKGPQFNISPELRMQIMAIALVAVAGVTALSLLSVTQGRLTAGWISLLRLGFGWGVYLVPLIFGASGFLLLLRGLDRQLTIEWERLVAMSLLFLMSVTAFHLLSFPSDPRQLAVEGGGGGYLGWLIGQTMIAGLGRPGTYVALTAMAGVGLLMLFNISIAEIGKAVAEGWREMASLFRRLPRFKIGRVTPPSTPAKGEGLPWKWLKFPIIPSPPPSRQAVTPRIIGGERQWRLPPIEEILEESIERELSQQEIRQKVRIIEETLASFGIPVKVVEVNQGPTITQFGIKPGYVEKRDRSGRLKRERVKVRTIASLADDLALALAASPVRIEAPVPGRSVVGIEVPNAEISLVALRGVMESEEFQALDSKLKLALGRDVSGQAVVADLTTMPHLLIAGATGSGKSVCINSITACLLCQNTPQDLKLLMIDPKRVELTIFNGIPHLLTPVVVDLELVVGALKWVTQEMDRRFKLFARAGVRNIDNYNQVMMGHGDAKGRLPNIVVIIDELADLMMIAPDEVERLICRIAQMARATGIHMVIATQRPSVDVVTGLIKANFPARISFAVVSQVDSRVVLDMGGAEKLLGRGDMLYMASDSSQKVRLQGSFVSDAELERLVRYWKGLMTPQEIGLEELVQKPLWDDLMADEEGGKAEDDLLDKAVALVCQHNRVSVSFLQRKLRIGYSRAARLMDLMEERGIVGSPLGPGQSREVLIKESFGFCSGRRP